MNVPVFAYHSLDASDSIVSMSPPRFERQMEFLRRNGYRSLSLHEYHAGLERGERLPPRSFVLTFDDAYHNVYEIAFPLLRKHGFSATIFAVTADVGRTPGWQQSAGVPQLPLCSWDQLAEMQAAGFRVQPHSRTHPDLTTLDDRALREEISGSRDEIRDRLGAPGEFFCYPHGKHDDRVVDVVRSLGFRGAVTVRFGMNDAATDPFRWRRVATRRFRKHSWAFRLSLTESGCRLIAAAALPKKLAARR